MNFPLLGVLVSLGDSVLFSTDLVFFGTLATGVVVKPLRQMAALSVLAVALLLISCCWKMWRSSRPLLC